MNRYEFSIDGANFELSTALNLAAVTNEIYIQVPGQGFVLVDTVKGEEMTVKDTRNAPDGSSTVLQASEVK